MTEEVFTLTRVPWFESMNWQIFIFLFFSIASVFGVLIAFWMALKGLKNRNKKSYYFLPMIIMGVSWIYFIARVIAFLSNPEFSQADEFFNFMSLLAYICTGLGIMCLGSIVLFWIKRQSLFIKIYYTFWGLSFALLVTWFNQLNLYTIS